MLAKHLINRNKIDNTAKTDIKNFDLNNRNKKFEQEFRGYKSGAESQLFRRER